jgi:hypothetical protein
MEGRPLAMEGTLSRCGQTTRGGLPAWELVVRLPIPHHKKKPPSYEPFNTALDLDGLSLYKQFELMNMEMRFSTWNTRSLYRAGSLVTVSK